ncbi:MAG: helix-turn-helix domain-containing protein [Chitinivibrionales bacterium]|nr:helix-turn-helix domain-containing protein [Chitinivibrionales bacterium]
MDGSFHISPLDDDDLWDGPDDEFPPHRHNHQEVIVLTSGQAMHCIDGEKLTVCAPAALLVAEGKIHLFITQKGSRGWLLRFTNEYLPLDITSLFSQFLEISTIPLSDQAFRSQIVTLCELMYALNQDDGRAKDEVICHLLSAFLHLLQSELQRLTIANPNFKVKDYPLFFGFLRSLEECYKTQGAANYYAQRLNVPLRKLRAICRSVFGQSPLKLIEQRRVIEAKRLLLYTDDNIGQIAYQIGFEDHSYFTRIFRRSTGLTPHDFRMKYNKK